MATALTDDVHVLASTLQQQMPGAWLEIKGSTFPGNPDDPDQKVLFLAIARGLLTYLSRKADLISQMDAVLVGGGPTETISSISYRLTDSSGGVVSNL
jgi:hypothetical protein